MGIELTPAAKIALAHKGYDPVLGARPLRRAIQREIEDTLSEKILYNELKAGQIVLVDAEGTGENIRFSFQGASKSSAIRSWRRPRPAWKKGSPPVAAGDDVASG